MNLFTLPERRFVAAISRLAYCNPFLPERIAREREALGSEFDEQNADWNLRPGSEDESRNLLRLIERSEQALNAAHARLPWADVNDTEMALYEDLLLFVLYHRWRAGFATLILDLRRGGAKKG